MPQYLSGPGLGLPFPQNYYPTELQNAAQDASDNRLMLAAGEMFVIPAGDWYISAGAYLTVQFLDPVTGVWARSSGNALNRGIHHISSDGYNARIANLTGCAVDANIVNAGSGYAQATTTITAVSAAIANMSVPTFVPIVGGGLAFTGTFGTDVPTKGAGYGLPPIIMIPPPPPPNVNANGVGGIPAQAIAIIGASGSISSVTMMFPGAGYPVAPTVAVVPSPFDPNLVTGITAASVSVSLSFSGSIMGVLCTNNGGPLNNGSLANITLTLGGAGSSGSLSAIIQQTVVAGTVSGPGVGYGTAETAIIGAGGGPSAGAVANANNLGLGMIPRMANLGLTPANTSVSVGSTATVYDGGLFEKAPVVLFVPSTGLAAPSTVATIAFVMGSRPDFCIIQPAP
jgi:hypothetical protein